MSRPSPLSDGRKYYKLLGRPFRGSDANGVRQIYQRNDWVPLTDTQYKNFKDQFTDKEAVTQSSADLALVRKQARVELLEQLNDAQNNPELQDALRKEFPELIPPAHGGGDTSKLDAMGALQDENAALRSQLEEAQAALEAAGTSSDPSSGGEETNTVEPLPDGWENLGGREQITLAKNFGAPTTVNSTLEAVAWLNAYANASEGGASNEDVAAAATKEAPGE